MDNHQLGINNQLALLGFRRWNSYRNFFILFQDTWLSLDEVLAVNESFSAIDLPRTNVTRLTSLDLKAWRGYCNNIFWEFNLISCNVFWEIDLTFCKSAYWELDLIFCNNDFCDLDLSLCNNAFWDLDLTFCNNAFWELDLISCNSSFRDLANFL